MMATAPTGCVPAPAVVLARGDRQLHSGRAESARGTYDALAVRAELPPKDRVLALVGAALASDRLGDRDGARARLERAAAIDVPGVSEVALYYLAEHVRDTDHARALNLYYRAAAGAEKHRGGAFPYQAAMDRILQLSVAP
jgi:hypothetical protein